MMTEERKTTEIIGPLDMMSEPAMLEQLEEECMELALAARKLARAMRGESPTPKPIWKCREKVIEEWADVAWCLTQLSKMPWVDTDQFHKVYEEKAERAMIRLKAKNTKISQVEETK